MRDFSACFPYTSISDHRFHEGVRSVHVFRAHHQRSLAAGGAVVLVRVHEQGVMMDPSVRDRVCMFDLMCYPNARRYTRTQCSNSDAREYTRMHIHTRLLLVVNVL